MQFRSLSDTEGTEAVEGVYLAQLGGGDRLNIQHFALEPGAIVHEHVHNDHEQLSFLYEGVLTFILNDGEVTAAPGDAGVLMPGESHAVENRGNVTAQGIDVYSPPRSTVDWIEE